MKNKASFILILLIAGLLLGNNPEPNGKKLMNTKLFEMGLPEINMAMGIISPKQLPDKGNVPQLFFPAVKQTSTDLEKCLFYKGAIIRGDTTKKEIALVFTGDEFADGGNLIADVLQKQAIHASFFLTGNFYRNGSFQQLIKKLYHQGNFLGPHSDRHLLYCDWSNRDSLLVTRSQYKNDLNNNLAVIKKKGIPVSPIQYFLPPYEWYNDSIASWTKEMGMQLINYSPGTLSAADYTYFGLKNYRATDVIYQSIIDKEKADSAGLKGFLLLLHIGTDPRRTDKFYFRLNELINMLKQKGYHFKKVNELLQ